MTVQHRKMKARKDSWCPQCGGAIRIGNVIHRFPDDEYFVCQMCALARNTAPPDTWADRMYAELGTELAGTAYKVLARVLHPDAGGSHEAMSALNRARDRTRGKTNGTNMTGAGH